MKYLALELPPAIRDLKIKEELILQIRQIELFRRRAKLGPEIVSAFFQPVIEPEEGRLCAIFIAPGENHFVFRDEVAPMQLWDEWYRAWRLYTLGRSADIESIEILDDEIRYYACFSWANLYETGFHYSGKQPWTGEIYSSTWNHMLTNKPAAPILWRDGYRRVETEIYYGDRDAAEEFARNL